MEEALPVLVKSCPITGTPSRRPTVCARPEPRKRKENPKCAQAKPKFRRRTNPNYAPAKSTRRVAKSATASPT